jgi:predicted lipid carrier protein YhbT
VLAADGIDELFAVIPYWPMEPHPHGDGETVHLHCTDLEGEWLVRLVPDGLVVTREHAKGDVAVRGTASDLSLFLYGRVVADALEVFGDAALLANFRGQITW